MTDDLGLDFDDATAVALAAAAPPAVPSPAVRDRVLQFVRQSAAPVAGFTVARAGDDTWLPHPVAGIRMKILALNKQRGYATLLLDVAPGTHFPPHHHGGAEECYVISGTVYTGGQRLGAGDFIHADAGSEHTELWTDSGAQVILVVPPEEHGL